MLPGAVHRSAALAVAVTVAILPACRSETGRPLPGAGQIRTLVGDSEAVGAVEALAVGDDGTVYAGADFGVFARARPAS